MVKRTQHIGTFLHNEMGISLAGISPMCGRSSTHLQKIFFLRSIVPPACAFYLSGRRYFAAASSPICFPMAVPTSVELR